MNGHELIYDRPAGVWVEALALGNGRLGAMHFGGMTCDEFQLNEDTLWSGGPYSPTNPEALVHLDEVRQLIFQGQYKKAEEVADAHLLARPYLQTSYQPAGRLFVSFDHQVFPSDYRRKLALDRAVSELSYRVEGTEWRRTSFVSAADNVMVIRLEADRPGAISCRLDFLSEQPGYLSVTPAGLKYEGRNRSEMGIAGALRWGMEARVMTEGGESYADHSELRVTNADSVTIIVDIATSFRRFDDVSGDPDALLASRLDAACAKSYDALMADHIAAHRALYDRFEIDLGTGPGAGATTDTRVANFQNGQDPGLAALYVRFARYLSICSSRPGTQPANLQGIWNREIRPPWGSKYTTNINIQMNYWLPDPANLAECFDPLIEMVEDLAETGAIMAKSHYGASGWVLHHNTDLWRATGPVDGAIWGLWPTGGAWFSAQLWDHVRYAGRPAQMVERVYPLLKGASDFARDILVPLPGTDKLVVAPSISPENVHPHGTAVCAGATMDNQILRDLFAATAEAARELGVDEAYAQELTALRDRLPADQIGAGGWLQEWLEDWDADVPEIEHRHVSHLYGLYPSQQINVEDTPDLANAARTSLEMRGDFATGWGIGWRINLWARLREGNHAFRVVEKLLHPQRTYANLFDAHPPFQIDGNFGGAAGILEMLAQSDERVVHLLPAIPDAWPTGKVRGLRVRGGIEVDFAWEGYHITEAMFRSVKAQTIALKIANGHEVILDLPEGEDVQWTAYSATDDTLPARLQA